jgi:predicted PhzF superfamily epimerase YddE/YHI9
MQIFQVDAFAKDLFQGNPAAVVPLFEWLPEEMLQRIAMENNLAETAYFVPEGNDYAIRWFTPTVEVDLCGHATLASAHVLFEQLGYGRDLIRFRSMKSGVLEVSRRAGPATSGTPAGGTGPGATAVGQLTLNFPSNPPAPVDPSSLGILFDGLGIPSQPLFKGTTDYMVVLDSAEAVEALRPDFRKLATSPGRGILVTAPGTAPIDFVSRCFFPQSGIDEDAVTGSAHTMLIPYWAERLGRKKLSAVQLSARRGYLDCELAGDRVYISGYAKTFMIGEILI